MTATDLIKTVAAGFCADADRAAVAVRRDGGWHVEYWKGGQLANGTDAAQWRFRLASLTKIMTAAVTVLLVRSGRLDLDVPANTYLRDAVVTPRRSDPPVTVRMLLTHPSGLGYFRRRIDQFRLHGGEAVPQWPGPALSDYYGPRVRARLRSGSWHYSSHNYGVLGLVLESIEAEPFHRIIRRLLLDPLGMVDTFLPQSASEMADIVTPGRRALNELVVSANGLIGTLPDVCTFTDALLGHRPGVLTAADTGLLFSGFYTIGAGFPAMGLGPVLLCDGMDRIAWHNAAYDRYRGSMIVCPDGDLAAVALGHGAGFRPDAVIADLVTTIRPETAPYLSGIHAAPGRASYERPVAARPSVRGVYRPVGFGFGQALAIRESGGRLEIGSVHRSGGLAYTPIVAEADTNLSGSIYVGSRRVGIRLPDVQSPQRLLIAPFTIARRSRLGLPAARVLAGAEACTSNLPRRLRPNRSDR